MPSYLNGDTQKPCRQPRLDPHNPLHWPSFLAQLAPICSACVPSTALADGRAGLLLEEKSISSLFGGVIREVRRSLVFHFAKRQVKISTHSQA